MVADLLHRPEPLPSRQQPIPDDTASARRGIDARDPSQGDERKHDAGWLGLSVAFFALVVLMTVLALAKWVTGP